MGRECGEGRSVYEQPGAKVDGIANSLFITGDNADQDQGTRDS
jgi:hypothetical protein